MFNNVPMTPQTLSSFHGGSSPGEYPGWLRVTAWQTTLLRTNTAQGEGENLHRGRHGTVRGERRRGQPGTEAESQRHVSPTFPLPGQHVGQGRRIRPSRWLGSDCTGSLRGVRPPASPAQLLGLAPLLLPSPPKIHPFISSPAAGVDTAPRNLPLGWETSRRKRRKGRGAPAILAGCRTQSSQCLWSDRSETGTVGPARSGCRGDSSITPLSSEGSGRLNPAPAALKPPFHQLIYPVAGTG